MSTLLIVDDEPIHRQLMATILADDFEVIIEAENGEEAVKLANSHRPDLIVMDIAMPRMNGLTALEVIKGMEVIRDIPVVIVSARCTAGEIKRAKEAGAVDYIVKPYNIWELPARLKRAIKK